MDNDELERAAGQLKSQLRRDVLAAIGTGVMLDLRASGARAETILPSGAHRTSGGLKAWSDYVELLKPAGDLIDSTWDSKSEQTRAELYRQLVMNIAQGYIWFFQATAEHPDWMPFENSIFMLQPNPDGLYHMAPVDGRGVYRVVGTRGSNKVMGFAVSPVFFGAEDPRPGFNNYDADGLTIGPGGRFEVIFSTQKPSGWAGDWRYLHPDARSLLIRQFSYAWGEEEEARFAIERLDLPALKPRPTLEDISPRLDAVLGNFTRRLSHICLDNQNRTAKRLGFNKMELTSFESMGNSAEWPQRYWCAIYDYAPGEALLLETELPKVCKYWNVQLNDTLWNQIEFAYRQSSLNGHQAQLDTDGKFRAVIALEDPGVPNWLDSGGFRRGMLVGRWYAADSHPLPTMTKVPIGEIRKHLPRSTPTVTAAERDQVLRARNIGVQLRKRW